MFYLSNARQPSVLRPQTTCPGELLLIDFLSESYSISLSRKRWKAENHWHNKLGRITVSTIAERSEIFRLL